ncbi:glycerol-3-phosphate dehydrogenase/oxidase [Rhodococcus zopfii]|uniref:glycerol-3-phosphate dehydrogenase/oxidase n=2 Tax=Rhodococcus zopfii TaxID=43772 RepID=UPI0009325073|nr:glycerol-3-phosphate dehydrogenase/oxidase [Rhodococcus zopfii]
MTGPGSGALSAARRHHELDRLADDPTVDVLVIGGGVTGAGVALDAAARGLSVVLAERHDLAFGTSRWSSKLVHGGLRYLATGNVGIAHESAVERGLLMTVVAPHLIRSMPQLVPLLPSVGRGESALVRAGFLAGDALRAAARTPAALLPRSCRVDADRAAALVPAVRRDGLRGGLLAHDGQLVDDARLVVALARTAATFGARILTRVSAHAATAETAVLHDEITGGDFTVRARAVINAAGVWAGHVDPSIALRPSRGTHLVLDAAVLGHPTAALTVPIPGATNRFVFALPAQLGRVYLGLTDEDAPGDIPDVPHATDTEIDFLLDTVNTALATALTRDDVLATYSGLRPLLRTADGDGATADLSRKHAVVRAEGRPIGIVGGKLTTYRKMAQDALDAAVAATGLPAGPCNTHRIPLVGAANRTSLARLPAPVSLVRRYGTEAAQLTADPGRLDPVAPGLDVCRAEFDFAITHEGALDADDILDRRTRIGLVPADRAAAHEAALSVLAEHRLA